MNPTEEVGMERHVVMLSGGVGSWAAAKRVAERVGTKNLTLLFADTRIEDQDTYRFLREGAANVGGELIEIADGRTPWQVFRDRRFLGNHRVDPCSEVLKRKLCDHWLDEHRDPADTIVYVGIDWSEMHRYDRLKARRAANGWRYEAPLCGPPYLTKDEVHAWAEREGLRKQRLYVLGLAHANCGGGCVKAGIGHWAHVLRVLPEVYAEWERNEEELRAELGDVSMLTDRRGGGRKPLPLKALREGIEAGGEIDLLDIGGCGCFTEAA